MGFLEKIPLSFDSPSSECLKSENKNGHNTLKDRFHPVILSIASASTIIRVHDKRTPNTPSCGSVTVELWCRKLSGHLEQFGRIQGPWHAYAQESPFHGGWIRQAGGSVTVERRRRELSRHLEQFGRFQGLLQAQESPFH